MRILSKFQQSLQGSRCPCAGTDDYCGCQNLADRQTIKEQAVNNFCAYKFNAFWTLERGEDEVFDVQVNYTMTPVVPAQTYGPAEGCYPAEGGEIEIQSVIDVDSGKVVTLTDAEEGGLVDWLEQNTDWSRYSEG